jgi:plasmid stabilization system protein ParE
MKRVEISAHAQSDIQYLRNWLAERSPGASQRATKTVVAAAKSLVDFPERGRLALEGVRELTVPFGSGGYVLQYFVEGNRIVIARVFHSLERR